MQVGSIVVVKKIGPSCYDHLIKWKPVDDNKTPYMVRGINDYGSVIFEEGVIGYWSNGDEIHLKKEWIVEILPPEDITEQVDEMISVPIPNTINNTLQKMKLSLKKFMKR